MTARTISCLFVLCSVEFAFAQQPPANSPMPTPTSTATASSSATPKPLRDLVIQLNQAGLQEVIEQLRSNYIDPNALTNQEINEAAVEGLLSKLGPGASLETKAQTDQPLPNHPLKSDLIEKRFAYVRLGSLTAPKLSQLDDALNDLRAKGASGLILDLRTMPSRSDFQLAADVLDRFVPKGRVLFSLVQPKEGRERAYTSSSDPIFVGPIAILVSSDNAGTAEAIAGTLRSQVHALIIGQKTSGRAVEYERYLVADRLVLTVAVSELVIPGTQAIFPNGLSPDIPVPLSKAQQDSVLARADENGITDFIFDEERPHTNEAALVAGKNPDLDAFETDKPAGKAGQRRLKDVVLQRAIDFLTTISVYRAK